MDDLTHQAKLIDQMRNSDKTSWLIMHDAGRADIFTELFNKYLDSYNIDYETVYNGGCTNTPQWFNEHHSGKYEDMLFHGGQPIRSIRDKLYNERNHFKHVPYTTLYDTNELLVAPPNEVNKVVEDHLPSKLNIQKQLHALGYRESQLSEEFNMYIVRYLQPHIPYRKLPESAGGKRRNIPNDPNLVREYYIDNYKWVLESMEELIEMIGPKNNNIIITSDHGECLGDCAQWFHAPNCDHHDHLVNVPWLEIEP